MEPAKTNARRLKNFVRFYNKHLSDRNVLVISFNPFVLMRLRLFSPNIPRGIICGSQFWKSVHNYLLRPFVQAQYYILNKRYLNDRNAIFAQPETGNFYRFYSRQFKRFLCSSTKNQPSLFDFRKKW